MLQVVIAYGIPAKVAALAYLNGDALSCGSSRAMPKICIGSSTLLAQPKTSLFHAFPLTLNLHVWDVSCTALPLLFYIKVCDGRRDRFSMSCDKNNIDAW